MSKKRTSLDAIFAKTVEEQPPPAPPPPTNAAADHARRPGVKQQTLYVQIPVWEQLRRLAFEEHAKMHDYLIEGLDLVFKQRGLPGIDELLKKKP